MDNGLQAILVSDPSTEKGAASMNVHVGSFSDPPSVPGLAHFLEHMMFLGTQKYPDEARYLPPLPALFATPPLCYFRLPHLL